MREKFKKGEIVTATRTFNGEIITGEFRGYHLFNDEIPDTVVGIVHVPGDGVYDVDVTSIRHHESKDERIRRELIEFIKWSVDRHFMREDFHQAKRPSEWIAYLEKQEEQDKCPEYCVRSHCIGCSIYEKQKEKWPIMEVFGFKVGDAVRLKDGDGRKHIIKAFEEIEGVHGPNFYHVEFEDNSARDGIYPGEEYPNGYYTQMEKFEEKQKPINESNMHEPTLDEARKWNEAYEKGYSLGYENGKNERKPVEWSEEDKDYYDTIVRKLEVIGDDSGLSDNQIRFLREHYPLHRFEWSEEDDEKLERVDDLLWMLDDYLGDDCSICEERTTRLREEIKNVLCPFLKSLRPQKLDASKLENFDPVDVLNRIKTEWPMAWEKVVGKQEWSKEDDFKLGALITDIETRSDLTEAIKIKYVSFLKSLRPWKPSEGQMKALRECGECKRCIKELYEDLQKRYGTC